MATAAKSSKRRTKKSARPFWWFQGNAVRQLYDLLGEYDPSTTRLEVHLDGKKMTFHVKRAAATEEENPPPINDSHVCPPQCP